IYDRAVLEDPELGVVPADRDDVEVAIAVDVEEAGAEVMVDPRAAGMDDVLREARPPALVLEDEETRRALVLAEDDIDVAIAVEIRGIERVSASDAASDDANRPESGWVRGTLKPHEVGRSARRMLEADHGIEVAVAVDVTKDVAIRDPERRREARCLELRPRAAVVSQPMGALEDVEVAVAVDASGADRLAFAILGDRLARPRGRRG